MYRFGAYIACFIWHKLVIGLCREIFSFLVWSGIYIIGLCYTNENQVAFLDVVENIEKKSR